MSGLSPFILVPPTANTSQGSISQLDIQDMACHARFPVTRTLCYFFRLLLTIVLLIQRRGNCGDHFLRDERRDDFATPVVDCFVFDVATVIDSWHT